MSNTRLNQLKHWLELTLEQACPDIEPLANDASFRQYFRVVAKGQSYVVMDAPPQQEDVAPFITIAELMRQYGIPVPHILASDPKQGFLLLTDFGDRLLLNALSHSNADEYYDRACNNLLILQTIDASQLPPFDADFMRLECNRFIEWYCQALLQCELSTAETTALTQVFEHIIQQVETQTQVMVHRDYHSRNLMLLEHDLGVIDFQDAVRGPITYDIVSLFRDCYISWPEAKVREWALRYRDRAVDAGLMTALSDEDFMLSFDMTSLQRHIKCVGIFARLALRDQKRAYLKDIPRVMAYIEQVAERYPACHDLLHFIQQRGRLPEALIA